MTLAMQVPERYPDPERLYRPMPPSPQALERMLETMRWVQWLDLEQRHLVWMRANRYEWQQIGRRFACDRNTASRRWHRVMELVAFQLNSGDLVAKRGEMSDNVVISTLIGVTQTGQHS
jgi:hypothetical protein